MPNRFISDIRDILILSSSLATQTVISIDQAYGQVAHQYLWQTLAAFGFNSGFRAIVQELCSGITGVKKKLIVG